MTESEGERPPADEADEQQPSWRRKGRTPGAAGFPVGDLTPPPAASESPAPEEEEDEEERDPDTVDLTPPPPLAEQTMVVAPDSGPGGAQDDASGEPGFGEHTFEIEVDRTIVTGSTPAPPVPASAAGPAATPSEGARDPDEPISSADGTIVLTPSADLPKIPDVTLIREIGRGGMGAVYEGTQGYLDRRVAVKVLTLESTSGEYESRFQREAKILAALTHPNIVACYQAGVAPDGRCYLTMEYIDGSDLAKWISAKGPLSVDQAVTVGRAIGSALAHAHRSGIIHRDVKPLNVLLKTDTHAPEADPFPFTPMLADLGLARAAREVPTSMDFTTDGLTVQGTVMGSPPTMAPEQFDAPDDVDFRTDIYGLGCILYHCLTGKLAFPQATLTKLIARKSQEKPPDPRELRRDVPRTLSQLVGDMLAPRPEDRPQSYDELLRRLEGPFQDDRRSSKLPLLVGAVVAAAAVAGWWTLGGGGEPVADEGERTAALDAPAGPGGAGLDPTAESDGGSAADTRPAAVDPAERAGDTAATGEPAPDPPGGGTEAREPEQDPGAPSGTTGSEDPPAGDPPVEPEEPPAPPTLALPSLTPIGAGEELPLLDGSPGRFALAGWQARLGVLTEDWQNLDDVRHGAQATSFDGVVAAEHELPAPPWSLAGELEMIRPFATTQGLVVVLAEGFGIELRQATEDGRVSFAANVVQADTEGAWTAVRALDELALAEVFVEDYRAAGAVAFELAWDAHRLRLRWNLGTDVEGGPEAAFTADELIAWGAPLALRLEVGSGVGVFRGLRLVGG